MNKLIAITSLFILAACGPRGRQGPPGPPGASGQDGASCQVITLLPDPEVAPNGGAQVTCGTGAPVLVLNGTDGRDAPTALQVVAIVDPCGDAPNIFDEVFFKLSDGRLIASMSQTASGLNTRLSVVPVGVRLITTDGSGCPFEVNAQGDLLP